MTGAIIIDLKASESLFQNEIIMLQGFIVLYLLVGVITRIGPDQDKVFDTMINRGSAHITLKLYSIVFGLPWVISAVLHSTQFVL